MSSEEIRKKFLDFFEKKEHAMVPSSSLIPTDNSVLLTTAGMQQFKPYYTGEADPIKDFGSKNAASIQKSFRTSDIDEVGDETHLTFFEMLGNFSFGYKPGEPRSPKGGYFKKEAITYAYDFITKEMGLEISYVTVFKGSETVPEDKESRKIWQSLGIKDENIREEGMEDVFWGPTGNSGPCGPTTEIYCRNVSGQDIEIWNIVFNQFFFPGSREELLSGGTDKKLEPLSTFGVDTGMGLERLAMISQDKKNIFETDLFSAIFEELGNMPMRSKRIVADNVRGAVFLIADGVLPANKERGYILRRLLRRAISHLSENQNLDVRIYPYNEQISTMKTIDGIAEKIIEQYGACPYYEYLIGRKLQILSVIGEEHGRFSNVNQSGRKILEKLRHRAYVDGSHKIEGRDIFELVTTHGFALEWIKDITREWGLNLDLGGFEEEFKKHQEISRTGQEKKFGGHGLILNTGEIKAGNLEELAIVTRLHTATHLLQQALRNVLGPDVKQAGSDITAERTRFDFSFPRKLTAEEIQKAESEVNEIVKKDLPVQFVELPKNEAEKTGALYFFKERYPDMIKVYFVGPDIKNAYSKEFCGGPHVTHTGEIGRFKIIKEEAVGAGVRRIRGVVQ